MSREENKERCGAEDANMNICCPAANSCDESNERLESAAPAHQPGVRGQSVSLGGMTECLCLVTELQLR